MNINITAGHYIIAACFLFSIGVAGLLMKKRNLINIMVSLEIMLLAVNINFVAFSSYYGNITGQIFTIMVIAIAAAEVSIGLAILIVYFHNRNSINIEDINEMKG